MKDVYVTDHKKKAEQLLTFSEEEDQQFYNYHKSLQSYKTKASFEFKHESKYEKGSLAQRVFDPLAGATRNADGTIVYTVLDKELSTQMNEDRLRAQYEKTLTYSDVLEDEGEDLRVALMEEIQANHLPMDQWNDMLDKELSIFKQGEKYDYVKDLQDAYQAGLSKPLSEKILDTIPAHHFWDIKKPIESEEEVFMNHYNPARKVANSDFFEFRSQAAWMKERSEKRLLKPAVSQERNY